MSEFIIRKETEEDYYQTEHMVLRAFWNQSRPGCNEHLLVHKLRESEDYLPELSRIAEMNGRIVGGIFASKARVTDKETEHEVLTFGPLAVEPTCISQGIGKALLEALTELGREAGYPGIVICGEPGYYPRYGFEPCEKFDIHHPAFGNADAFMAYPLSEAFREVHGFFYESPVFETCEDEAEIRAFIEKFPYYKPLKLPCWLHKEKYGRVAEVRKNRYVIQFWELELPAVLKGHFYEETPEKLPVVGDYVIFTYNPKGSSVIQSVAERQNLLQRPDQAKTGTSQYMAANVDYVFIITALDRDYNYNRIARYACMALSDGAIPVVILTKSDLSNNPGRYVREAEGIAEKVRVHAISARYGIGLDELKEYFCPGNTICLLGSSGAGKSTLVNALSGEEIMETSEVRASDSRGRHTTTHRQLIRLKNGVSVIDTPGMREFGLADAEEGIGETFSDILELARHCRFSDCRHEKEPGCAVKAAIERGELTEERLRLYKNLGKESADNHVKMKEISKWAKAYKKNKNKPFWD